MDPLLITSFFRFQTMRRTLWSRRKPPARRVGTTILEMVVAATVLTVGATVIAQGSLLLFRQQSALNRRAAALQEAANVVEQIGSLPWAELTAERFKTMQPSAAFLEHEPHSSLQVVAEDVQDSPNEKLIRISVRRTTAVDQQETLAELITWRFAPELPR